MNTIDRREDIVRRLTISAEPISASSLAAAYGVSRQIIVGDIALLRASGEKISSTPRGYILSDGGPACIPSPAPTVLRTPKRSSISWSTTAARC